MKKLLVILLVSWLIPQVTLAVWWNPRTWKIFNNKTVATELVQPKSESGDTTDREATTTKKIDAPISTKTESSKKSPESNKKVSNQHVEQTPQLNTNGLTSDEIFKMYTNLKAVVISDKNSVDRDSRLQVDMQYIKYLKQIIERLDADIGYLDQSKDWALVPPNIPQIYAEKFNRINEDYLMQKRSYLVDRSEALTVLQANISSNTEVAPSQKKQRPTISAGEVTCVSRPAGKYLLLPISTTGDWISGLAQIKDKNGRVRSGDYLSETMLERNGGLIFSPSNVVTGDRATYTAFITTELPIPRANGGYTFRIRDAEINGVFIVPSCN